MILLRNRLSPLGLSGMGPVKPNAPEITSDGGGSSATVNVNTGDTAVTTVVALGAGQKQYYISGGANASLFTLDRNTGVLAFVSASIDGDYTVVVTAATLFGSDSQTITAHVGYIGLLDLVAGAIVAYSQRAMTAGSTADAITIRRDSDNATQTFALVDNAVDAAAVASFLAAANGFSTAWKDQSGNANHAVQSTVARQPGWVASTANSKPGLSFSNAGHTFLGTGAFNVAGEMSAFVVCKATALVDNYVLPLFGANWDESEFPNGPDYTFAIEKPVDPNPARFAFRGDALNFSAGNGFAHSPFAAFSSYILLEVHWNASAGELVLDGAIQTLTQDSPGDLGTINLPLAIGANDLTTAPTTGDCFNGQIVEFITYPLLSSGDKALIRQNMADYYGITLS